jgi:hypothetical protein
MFYVVTHRLKILLDTLAQQETKLNLDVHIDAFVVLIASTPPNLLIILKQSPHFGQCLQSSMHIIMAFCPFVNFYF